jgi:hypothetical protein
MPNVLGVAALELGDPMPLGVLVKANDTAIRTHARSYCPPRPPRLLPPVAGSLSGAGSHSRSKRCTTCSRFSIAPD